MISQVNTKRYAKHKALLLSFRLKNGYNFEWISKRTKKFIGDLRTKKLLLCGVVSCGYLEAGLRIQPSKKSGSSCDPSFIGWWDALVSKTMVLILDGNSMIGAYVKSNLC